MNKSQIDFMRLLQNAVKPDNAAIDDIKYSEVEFIAINHICLPLVCYGGMRASLEMPERWKQHALSVSASNYKNLSVQAKIISALKENNIACAVLKGITVSRCYPEPLYRPLGDIDILVSPDNYKAAIDVLTKNAQKITEHNKHKFHYQYVYEGVTVEIHNAVTEPDDERGHMLKKRFAEALNNVEYAEYDGFSFPMLPAKFQIASLVLHMQSHFLGQKITMRMICDMAMAVRNIDTDVWDNEVYLFLVELNVEKFTCAVLSVCAKYLGIDFGNKIKLAIDDETADELMTEFLRDGRVPEYKVNREKKHFLSILTAIKVIVNRDFGIVKKIPILFPVFFLYVPVRSLWRKLTGRRKNVTISGYSTSYNRRNDVYKKLM